MIEKTEFSWGGVASLSGAIDEGGKQRAIALQLRFSILHLLQNDSGLRVRKFEHLKNFVEDTNMTHGWHLGFISTALLMENFFLVPFVLQAEVDLN